MSQHSLLKLCFFLLLNCGVSACAEIKNTNQLSTLTKETLPNNSHVTNFVDGDRIVFIGDSITHGGSYHKNVFLFNATRYPNKKIRYYNAGISGDDAVGTVKRFNADIAIHKPTIATIMLGMNDTGSWLYEKPSVTTEDKSNFIKQQSDIRNKYLSNMETLAQKLTMLGTKIIFIKPSIFDETVAIESNPLIGRNAELANFGDHLSKLAVKYNATVVDFQTPMLEVNKVLQAKDPKATVVSHDRVHPGENGHFVMSYGFLKDQQESKYVSNFQFNAQTKSIENFTQCELLNEAIITPSNVEFTCQAKTLPFPISKGQHKAKTWVPFQTELNQQFFRVANLEKGQYELAIDNIAVGQYTATTLSAGINLADNTKTPMYQQAIMVKNLNDQRAKVSADIRTVAHVQYRMLAKNKGLDFSNLAQVKKALDKYVAKSNGKPWHGYLKGQAQKYFNVVEHLGNNRKKVDQLFDEIYQVNQPKIHHWKLTKI